MIPIPSPRGKRRARIEIIPLIDIVFFLLATFVMVSLSMVKNQGISVNLPVAGSGSAQSREGAVTLSIRADGQVFWDKEPVSTAGLDERLQAFKASTAEPRVIIQGDVKSEFGLAIGVLDAVRRQGIAKVAIQTQPLQASGASHSVQVPAEGQP